MQDTPFYRDRIPRLNRVKLRDQVADALTEMVLAGNYAAGAALPSEANLAEMLGVSRIVLREAMQWLEAQGLVDIVQGKGIFVKAPDSSYARKSLRLMLERKVATLMELWQARFCLEPEIAALAAEHATPEQLDALRQIVEQMRQAGENRVALIEADASFHFALAEAAGNGVLQLLMEAVGGLLLESLQATALFPIHATTDHALLVEALYAHDQEAARKAMQTHLWRTQENLQAYVEAHADKPSDAT